MASGRMLQRKITLNKSVHDLSCDTSRLAYTWCLPFLDREGRVNGEPALLRAMIFPRRTDITIDQMESYIAEWAREGLVVWYESKGERWLSFPGFHRNNPNLRKEREAASTIPGPEEGTSVPAVGAMPAELRQNSGRTPEEVRQDSGASPQPPRHGADKMYAEVIKLEVSNQTMGVSEVDLSAPHMQWALDWYRRFTEETGQPVKPSSEDFAAARRVMEERGLSLEVALGANEKCFDPFAAYFFTRDPKSDRPRYHFKRYLANILEVLNDLSERPTKAKRDPPRVCPACGATQYAQTANSCYTCGLLYENWENREAIEEAKRDYQERCAASEAPR